MEVVSNFNISTSIEANTCSRTPGGKPRPPACRPPACRTPHCSRSCCTEKTKQKRLAKHETEKISTHLLHVKNVKCS